MVGVNLLNSSRRGRIDSIRIDSLIDVIIGTLTVVFNRCQLGVLFVCRQSRISFDSSGHLLGFSIDITLLGRLLTIRWCAWDVVGINRALSSSHCLINSIGIRRIINVLICFNTIGFNLR